MAWLFLPTLFRSSGKTGSEILGVQALDLQFW